MLAGQVCPAPCTHALLALLPWPVLQGQPLLAHGRSGSYTDTKRVLVPMIHGQVRCAVWEALAFLCGLGHQASLHLLLPSLSLLHLHHPLILRPAFHPTRRPCCRT